VLDAISFVIPALNEERLIARCIWSIKAEISRSKIDSEIIVVDNGSTDATACCAVAAGAKWLYEPRRGTNQARQTGFERSRYSLVAFVDADNELEPGWIGRAVAWFADQSIVAVSGPYRYRGASLALKLGAKAVFGVMHAMNKFRCPTIMGGNYIVRREALDAIGGHNTEIKFWGDDTSTALALSKVGRINFDPALRVNSSSRRFIGQGYASTLFHYWGIGFLGSYFIAARRHRDPR